MKAKQFLQLLLNFDSTGFLGNEVYKSKRVYDCFANGETFLYPGKVYQPTTFATPVQTQQSLPDIPLNISIHRCFSL